MATRTTGIRRCGPGKFVLVMDKYVWEETLKGWCVDEVGSAEDGAWYGRVPSGVLEKIARREADLTEEERELLLSSVGAVVMEDDRGFVDIQYYRPEEDLDRVWNEIREQFEIKRKIRRRRTGAAAGSESCVRKEGGWMKRSGRVRHETYGLEYSDWDNREKLERVLPSVRDRDLAHAIQIRIRQLQGCPAPFIGVVNAERIWREKLAGQYFFEE